MTSPALHYSLPMTITLTVFSFNCKPFLASFLVLAKH